MISTNPSVQNQQHRSLRNAFDSQFKASAQKPLTQWALSFGIAAVTALFSLPTQAITIGQVRTEVTPYIPRNYTVLDVADGAYVPINTNGQLTTNDFFDLNANDPMGTALANVTHDAQRASNNLFAVTNPTASYGRIDATTTFTGVGAPGFRNVIDTTGINLSGQTLTINAARGESVFINIDGDLNLSGNSAIELTGGIRVENVLFNVSGDVSVSGGSDASGTILAVGEDSETTIIESSSIGGTVIGRNLHLADSYVDGVHFVPEPFTILGTLTATGFAAVFKKESDKKKNRDKTKV